jgi:Rrf2 family transcriptional regulator, nitric oxide-sensitive transcriptional repressor
MKITNFSDYALRILIYLAVNDGELASAREVATNYNISSHHVAKASKWLVRHGYVAATRGKGGGMKLALSPEVISIGKIIREAEANTGLVECMREEGKYCAIESACGLAAILYEARDAFFKTLDSYSLADATTNRNSIAHLLKLNESTAAGSA